jgi:hypothetical protein
MRIDKGGYEILRKNQGLKEPVDLGLNEVKINIRATKTP